MEKQEKNHRVEFTKIVCFILVVLLCAVPCSATVAVYADQTVDINYGVDYLMVYNMGTANLYPGAEVYTGILAFGGSTINFYGGQMSQDSYIIAFSSATNPKITVYGRNFAVNGQTLDPSETSFTLDYLRPYHELTGFYENGDPIKLKFRGSIPINLNWVALDSGIAIDVKPGNEQNNINLKSNGVVPVAVLTTEQFDAATLDPATALFAGAAPDHWSLEDVDGDGDNDVIFHFRTQELDLDADSTEATLTAQLASEPLTMNQMTTMSAVQTSGGTVVSGTDAVKIVSDKKPKK
jgi:hypothetical protein